MKLKEQKEEEEEEKESNTKQNQWSKASNSFACVFFYSGILF